MIARLIKFNPKKPHFTSESIKFNSRWSRKVSFSHWRLYSEIGEIKFKLILQAVDFKLLYLN
jgi:hypothetical protein